jgi:hypothetical protein
VPDDLDVSGGGTAVSTEDLERAAQQLARLAGEAAGMSAELSRLDTPSTPGAFYGDQARVDVELAVSRLHEISRRAAELKGTLETAARGYVIADQVAGAFVRGAGSTAAYWLGDRMPGVLMTSGLLVSIGGGLWAGIRAAGGLGGIVDKPFEKEGGVPKASPFLKEHNYVINDAKTVSSIRTIAQSLGPFLLGFAGSPTGVAQAYGPGAFEQGAKGLIAPARSVGLFEETRVKLVETVAQPVTGAPRDYADRLGRVPYFDEPTGPQVVIEKYTVPGGPDRFSVYIAGTVTFSPVTTTEPWDMTSNMLNAAGGESGSVAAVRVAMAAAGVDENSPVQFTGYSQGGGTAARLAASGDYNAQGLLTFGGPTGQVPLPEGLPAVLVEHADDPVPALGGEQDNAGAVLVRRDVFGGQNLPTTYGVPSHHYEYYMETARLMDRSGSPQLDATVAALDEFTAGATLESSTAYRLERDR